ncbi:thiol peroxidase [Candidatus Gracilibacteria bacterium]|nr:thiol peroxidase [Candidatus Gracilibacteria bacterium]
MRASLMASTMFFLIVFASCSSGISENQEEQIVLNIPDNYTVFEVPDSITVQGGGVNLAGELLMVGDVLEDVILDKRADYFDEVDSTRLSDYAGIKLIQTVPSLDTPVCTLQTKQLEAAAEKFSDTQFITISNDTPFALQRFCSANKIDNLVTLSDARTREFGQENSFLLPEYGLLTRAIMIVDESLEILYIEYAEEVTHELNLENALAFLQSL